MARTPADEWIKFDALRHLCDMLALGGRKVSRAVAVEVVPASIAVLASDRSTPLSRSACIVILDFIVPGWRDTVPAWIWGGDLERNDPSVTRWRRAVVKRDGYACRRCGANEELEAHHIRPWARYPALRIDLDNGETLCAPCHKAHHHVR